MADDVREQTGVPQIPRQATPELRTFLIADVRGYTSFTQRRGDELAAKLAAKFAAVARAVVVDHDGQVLELRGDEALCVFVSPRQAIRAAAALQRRFVEETRWEPLLPLPVGIGIDVGEAVPVEGGYRGGALNLAARLCSMAKPGQILATAEVTHLARRLEGLAYQPQDAVQLKGLTDPVRPVRVLPEGDDPAQQLAALGALPPKAPGTSGSAWLPGPARRHPRATAGTVAVAVVAMVASLVVTLRGSGGSTLSALHENVVAAIDITSGHLVTESAVGSAPEGVAVDRTTLWVTDTNDDTVSRIDTVSGTTTSVDVGAAPVAVVVGANGVWVANSGSGTVSRIDPASGRVTLTVQVGGTPAALAFGSGALWVADASSGSLLRLDPGTAAVKTAAHVGLNPSGVAEGGGHVWVTDAASADVVDFDIASRRIVQTVHVGNDPRGIAVIGNDVWVVNNLDGTLTRINAVTAAVTATLPVGAGPVSVAADKARVWVAAQDAGWISEVDAHQTRVVRHIRTGSQPAGIALADRRVWLTAGVNPALHRGGTERVSVVSSVHLDPAQGYDTQSESVDAMLYDGLVGFRRTSGAAGSTIVPDLAVALPTVTDNGRTYTFRLRSGVVWSDGTPVTGEDLRRGLERTVAAGVWPLYGGIHGASACSKTACDLSAGIDVDDSAHLMSIHLTASDPEFLYKLALLGAVAMPSGTPIGALHGKAPAATGPYRVAGDRGGQVVLVRNERFHEWSAAAQPAGYPDRIEVSLHRDVSKPLPPSVVETGDWTELLNTPNVAGLRARFGDRVHLTPRAATQFLALNTRQPPFDDVRVRRAASYAIDRAGVRDLWPMPGEVTCQLLPPTIPSYQQYCPYTLRRGTSRTWQAPDVATAQRLIRAAGAVGTHVEIWTPPGLGPAMASVSRSLRSVGLDPHVHVVTAPNYFGALLPGLRRGAVQAMFDGWLEDYPAASNFFATELTCDTDAVADAGSNFARFCDPGYDRRITAAERLQARDPAAAAAAWTSVDQLTSDLAPVIPLITPLHVSVVSARLHNDIQNSGVGALYDQAWVR